ncbi:MAG TPA: secretin N-terminal domain-containing protein [Candidatus Tectomicrobia bacterium]|nr:secretin N-terminal domain-containing protein [Candidatus Tectomicrobia bacterium]
MTSRWVRARPRRPARAGLGLVLLLTVVPAPGLGAPRVPCAFENVDITIVIAEVARLTGRTFLYDPARVRGTITALGPRERTPAEALELLRSALALHGYAMVERPEATWIVPAREVPPPEVVVRVVRLTYADAGEVAATLAWVAPPGVRIAPYVPTNSLVIAGPDRGVAAVIDAIR